MKKIGIFFGSSTGATEEVAGKIGEKVGVSSDHIHNISEASLDDFANYDVLLLGSSTWGEGDLQDDWTDYEDDIKDLDLAGKTVALFGLGDAGSFSDSFCGGIGKLYELLQGTGCEIVGKTSPEGYEFDDSPSLVDGEFVGLVLDEANEYDKTDDRIDAWVNQLQSVLN